MRRIGSIVFAASISLGICGCMMPLGYAYPNFSRTPSMPIAEDVSREIHAFRLDFVRSKQQEKDDDGVKCEFREIDLSARKVIPSQTSAGISYFWGLYFFPSEANAFENSVRTHDKWVRVRLYRRGYETIELGPEHTGGDSLDWLPAVTGKEREEAIDHLLGSKKESIKHLEPGSRSKEHQAFFAFVADEYERLANTVSEDSWEHKRFRQQLFDKATRLRKFAAMSAEGGGKERTEQKSMARQ